MLKLENVTLGYEDEAVLTNLSVVLNEHATMSIIGPSGSGKSTLLLAVAKQANILSGSVMNDFAMTNLLLQTNNLFPWKTIRKNIELGLTLLSKDKVEINRHVQEIAEELKITHVLESFPRSVSGGERQRASLARALVMSSDLLLMDEPSAALDSFNQENFQDLLLALQRKHQFSLMVVTHNIEEAVILGQKICVLDFSGQIHIIDNPYFGKTQLRGDIVFFEQTQKIKQMLNGVK